MEHQDLSVFSESQLAEWYINNRNWLADREREYEASTADVNETQKRIEFELQQRLNAAGATSFRTQGGTVTQSIRTSYTAEDPAAFGQFIIASGNYEATTIRPSKEFVEDYRRQNDGQLPPGVGVYSKAVISVKKPTSK